LVIVAVQWKQSHLPAKISSPETPSSVRGSTARPSLEVETEVMKTSASGLAANLNNLKTLFPHGFGALEADLRRW
jgi:hypothetical protein